MVSRLIVLLILLLVLAGCGITSSEDPTPTTVIPLPTLATRTSTPSATPSPSQTPSQAAPQPQPGCTVRTDWPTYTVVAGDNLGRIAARAGTTIAQLSSANCLSDPNQLRVGQVLRVPRIPTTPTPSLTQAPAPEGARLRFGAGTTNIYTPNISIPAGATHTYLLNVSANQQLSVSVQPSNPSSDQLRLNVSAAGYGTLSSPSEPLDFVGTLPTTADYVLKVSASTASQYTLNISVPARISFEPGAVSARVQGSINGTLINSYLLNARGGQHMTVTINSPRNDLFLTIYGVNDGTPLLRAALGQTQFSGTLPQTQDYMIMVVPQDTSVPTTDYSLTVEVVSP